MTVSLALGMTTIAAVAIDGLQRPDWRGVVEALDKTGPRAIVVSQGGDDPALYYARENGIKRMPASGAQVNGITVVRSTPTFSIDLGRAFVGRSQRNLESFSIREYSAAQPTYVSPGEITQGGERVLLLPAPPR